MEVEECVCVRERGGTGTLIVRPFEKPLAKLQDLHS